MIRYTIEVGKRPTYATQIRADEDSPDTRRLATAMAERAARASGFSGRARIVRAEPDSTVVTAAVVIDDRPTAEILPAVSLAIHSAGRP